MDSEKEGGPEKSHESVIREEIKNLREDISNLKNKEEEIEEDQNSLDAFTENLIKLNSSINQLVTIFEKAGEIMEKEEERKEDTINELLSQNKKIAVGIKTLADMIKAQQKDIEELQDRLEQGNQREEDTSFQQKPGEDYQRDHHISGDEGRNENPSAPTPPPSQPGKSQQDTMNRRPPGQTTQSPPGQSRSGEPGQGNSPTPPPSFEQGSHPPNQNASPRQGQESRQESQGDFNPPPEPPEDEVPEPPEEKGFFSKLLK